MEFIERLPLVKLQYLKSLSFKQYKTISKKSASNDEDRKIQFDILKKFCDNAIKANGEIKRLYKFTGNNTWGPGGEGCGRLFSAGLGIQGMPKAIRGFLLNGITSDIDMANAHPVILRYLCRKHEIPHEKLDMYIEKRDEILAQFPDRDSGKTLFLKATNHDKINKKEKNVIFREYDKEMKEIQKILTKLTSYKDIVKDVPENRLYNWNGSAMNRIMCFYENKILQVIIEKLNAKGIEICAPMFDGCMPYGIHDESLLRELEDAINSEFPGLDMKLTLKTHSNEIVMPEDFKPEDAAIAGQVENEKLKTANNDQEASQLIWDEKMKDILVFSDGIFYYKKDGVWVQDRKLIESDIRYYVINSEIYSMKGEKKVDYCQNRRNADNVTKNILDIAVHFSDDNWVQQLFHSSLGKILFNNGYYDFRKSQFFKIGEEGYDDTIKFTAKIPFDMNMDFTEDDVAYIASIRERMFSNPFGEEVGNWYILQLARGLAGDCMKRFLVGIGSSNTGKSLLSSALKSTCGGYYGGWNGVNICYKNNSADEAQKLRWMKLLRFKRIIVSNEIQMGIEIDGNMIKKMSNGGLDDIIGREHCGNESEFKVGFLPILFAQDMDRITPKDDAVVTRMRAVHYEKPFVDNPANEFELLKDPNIESEIQTERFRTAFLMMLMQAYTAFQENSRVEIEPEGVVQAKAAILGDDENIIHSFISNFGEITNNPAHYIESKDIQKWLKDGDYKVSATKFGLEMNKYLKMNKRECCDQVCNKPKKIKNKSVQVWVGLQKYSETLEESLLSLQSKV